jgi:hypothetical protein
VCAPCVHGFDQPYCVDVYLVCCSKALENGAIVAPDPAVTAFLCPRAHASFVLVFLLIQDGPPAHRYIILGGSFDDFSATWYEYVGECVCVGVGLCECESVHMCVCAPVFVCGCGCGCGCG